MLLTAVLIEALVLLFATVTIALLKPEWLRTTGVTLCRLSDAISAARESFKRPATPARKPVSSPQFNPLLEEDVVSALVNLGTNKTTAKAAARKALETETNDFEAAFVMALKYAR